MARIRYSIIVVPITTTGQKVSNVEAHLPGDAEKCVGVFLTSTATPTSADTSSIGKVSLSFNNRASNSFASTVLAKKSVVHSMKSFRLLKHELDLMPNSHVNGYYVDYGLTAVPYNLRIYIAYKTKE